MLKPTLIAGLLLATAAVPLAAQDTDAPGPGPDAAPMMPMFEAFDADGDGKVTKEEVDAYRANRFAEVDADGNGEVSLEEFKAEAVARAEERAAEMFARLDADGDGVLSRDVLESNDRRGAMAGRMFDRLDTDGDGAVSKEEVEAAMMRRAEMHGPGKGRGEHGHMEPHGEQAPRHN